MNSIDRAARTYVLLLSLLALTIGVCLGVIVS